MIQNIKNKILDRLEIYLDIRQQSLLEEIKSKFKSTGKVFSLKNDYTVHNPQYIEIGENFSALERFRIEAWDHYLGQNFSPFIKIGDNVIFNTDIHIGCINSIIIGNNCLFASRIYITDHNHGDTSADMLRFPPKDRPLVSKGPVVIEDNVWVGEGVAIMPGVTIGKNSIIAANAVVTKDVPADCVFGGVPGKVIKYIK